jgi:hypothetical protein
MAGSTPISSGESAGLAPATQPTPAEDAVKADLWIFREGKREISGRGFLQDLQERLANKHALVDALIQAGQLESALADACAPGAAAAAALTDALAAHFCGENVSDPATIARQIETTETINVSPPEGFTYYAMHPRDFAAGAEQVASLSPNFAVLGIRSIGSTLSAVVAAQLKVLGRRATRITVRPKGHPYDRQTRFSLTEELWIAEQNSQSALFLVVDEGPGRSGSTFLSVGEALQRSGVPSDRIVIIGSREFDPSSLCAQLAAERWGQFRFLWAPPAQQRFANWHYLGNGEWRQIFCGPEREWPESWTQMERLKALSPDHRELVKFEGMGPLGEEVRARAFVLAEAGFSPAVRDFGDGFLCYMAISGRRLQRQDIGEEALENIARYCAFRASEFRLADSTSAELEHMLGFNIQQEFGHELKLSPGQLASAASALPDGRMQPYEWIESESHQLLKTDAISHGDNHFFPGPSSITWDIAGTVIEWGLDASAGEYLLKEFRHFSGIDLSRELPFYLLAYSVFRLGFCKMARSTVRGTAEELRLDSAYRSYRAKTERILKSLRAA